MSDRYTLLLADDSTTIQRVVALTFANENIDVVAVSDGDRAIDTMRHSVPDIVLADIGMPGRNGYDLARHIKNTPGLAHIPVVLLAGAFEPVDEARAAEVGSDGTLVKPFDPHVVIQRVKDLLATKPAPTKATEAPVAAKAPALEAPPAPPVTRMPAPPVAASAPEPLVFRVPEPPPSKASEPSPAVSRPAEVARLDDYFETLDQAFAARTLPPTPVRLAGSDVVEDMDPLPESAIAADVGDPEPVVPEEPLLAGAFSALLAAEQSGAAPDAFVEWLPPEPSIAEDTVTLSDKTIDTIVTRLIERLSGTVVRDAVTAVASVTAERLVREEIERIKSNIK